MISVRTFVTRWIPVAVIGSTLSWPATSAQAGASALQPMGYHALEHAYMWMAAELASADAAHRHYPVPSTLQASIRLCEKINPDAIYFSTAFFGLEAWSHGYIGSKCFMQLAAIAKAPELCDRIRVPTGPPPRRFLPADANRPITPEECRKNASSRGEGGMSGSYDFETMVALLGYTRADVIARSSRSPDESDAYELLRNVLPLPSDDSVDYHKVWNAHLQRLERLPDFSRGDASARRQLDALVPGWSSPANASPLAVTLRCSVERAAPGRESACD